MVSYYNCFSSVYQNEDSDSPQAHRNTLNNNELELEWFFYLFAKFNLFTTAETLEIVNEHIDNDLGHRKEIGQEEFKIDW